MYVEKFNLILHQKHKVREINKIDDHMAACGHRHIYMIDQCNKMLGLKWNNHIY